MSPNLNPHTVSLLAWHGQAAAGVRVPFRPGVTPLGATIQTELVRRLRALAGDLASSDKTQPRWIFLVGGPGNGKSETVQDFLTELDGRLALGGALVRELSSRFSASGLIPRKVEVTAADVGDATEFAAKIGRLIVVQDATATDTAVGNAASELANDLTDLLTAPPTVPAPIFVACANRGLLARALNEAYRELGKNNDVTRLLASLIQASSLASDTLAGFKSCWPLEGEPRVACWPLDMETLLDDSTPSPFETILQRASDVAQWEVPGRCEDCSSRDICPFRQNAEWLRDVAVQANLRTLLRRGELARGQRWNFRDAFSLSGEVVVGQWSDFEPIGHPCEWVHQQRAKALSASNQVHPVVALASHLYPQALFRRNLIRSTARSYLDSVGQVQPITAELLSALAGLEAGTSSKPIRETLEREYPRLDPAMSTPNEPSHPLRSVEDAFCQSVSQGRAEANSRAPLPMAEQLLFDLLEKAEVEWDVLGRQSASANSAVCLVRKIAGILGKRSVGVRLGYHALDDLLARYEKSLRDATELQRISAALRPFIADTASRFNLLEVLGQPTAEAQPLVGLQGPAPGIRALAAPRPTATTPGHDVPCIEITDPQYRIALTFDFYMALQLRKQGCAGSSLPASVRAALDRVRQRYAGKLCRDDNDFIDGRTSIHLSTGQRIGIPAPGSPPSLLVE